MIHVSCEVVTIGDDGALNAPADKEYYRIAVSDNGIGFEPQYARQIFELFQRMAKWNTPERASG
jgi:signal transduction histidine kinase